MQTNNKARLIYNAICAALTIAFIIGAIVNIQTGKARQEAINIDAETISNTAWQDYRRLRGEYENAAMLYAQTLEVAYESLPDAEILPLPKREEDKEDKQEANAWTASGFDNLAPSPEAYQQAYNDLLAINTAALGADKADCSNALLLKLPYIVDAESAARMEGAAMFSNFLWEKTVGPLWSRGSKYDSRRKTESYYEMVMQINDDYRYLLYERLEELKGAMSIQNGRLEAVLPYYEKLKEGYDADLVKALNSVGSSYWEAHDYHDQAVEVAFLMQAMHAQMVVAAPSASAQIPVDLTIERYLREHLEEAVTDSRLRPEVERILDGAAAYTDAISERNFETMNKDYDTYYTNVAYDGSLWLKRMDVTEITVNDWEDRPLKIAISDGPDQPLYEFYYSGATYQPYLARRYSASGELIDTYRWFISSKNYSYFSENQEVSGKLWKAAIWLGDNMHSSTNGRLDATELYNILNG